MPRKKKEKKHNAPPAPPSSDECIVDPSWVPFDPLPVPYLRAFPASAAAGCFVSEVIADRVWAPSLDPRIRLAVAQCIAAQCVPWHGFTEQLHSHITEFHNRAHPEILRRCELYQEEILLLRKRCDLLQERLDSLEARPTRPPSPLPIPTLFLLSF